MDSFQSLIHAVSDACDRAQAGKILDAGLDVNYQNAAGCTALMFTVMPNDFGDDNSPWAIKEMVEFLLGRGARTDLKDEAGLTAQDYCRQLIDPEFRDKFGDSPSAKWTPEGLGHIEEMLELLDPSLWT
ncbi:MAG: ankyrin repeat domain-containing protein [Acidobacteriota bacterium]